MKYKKDVILSISDRIYNIKQGHDVEPFSFGILYKTGEYLVYFSNALPEDPILLKIDKIEYCWVSNTDYSVDSFGTRMLNAPDIYESFGLWIMYVESMTEQILPKLNRFRWKIGVQCNEKN